jgi:hypothetical protein
VVAIGILNAIGMSPRELQTQSVSMLASKATAVMTNVPGPPIPLYLAGKKIDQIMFWVPQAGRVALGISILSYANRVYLGVNTDAGLIPNPDEIVDGFYDSFDVLLELATQVKEDKPDKAPPPQPAEPKTKAAPAQEDPDRCQAVTQNGRRCRNRSLENSNYCRLHQKEEKKEKDGEKDSSEQEQQNDE